MTIINTSIPSPKIVTTGTGLRGILSMDLTKGLSATITSASGSFSAVRTLTYETTTYNIQLSELSIKAPYISSYTSESVSTSASEYPYKMSIAFNPQGVFQFKGKGTGIIMLGEGNNRILIVPKDNNALRYSECNVDTKLAILIEDGVITKYIDLSKMGYYDTKEYGILKNTSAYDSKSGEGAIYSKRSEFDSNDYLIAMHNDTNPKNIRYPVAILFNPEEEST